jgi:hypothetical protein
MASDGEPRADALRLILEQNCLHARHVESVRLRFTSIYVVVVGAVFALIGSGKLQDRPFILVFLLALSIAGIVVTHNLEGAYRNHVARARETAAALGVDKYFATGRLFKQVGTSQVFMHPWEFYLLYLLVAGFCIISLIWMM